MVIINITVISTKLNGYMNNNNYNKYKNYKEHIQQMQ